MTCRFAAGKKSLTEIGSVPRSVWFGTFRTHTYCKIAFFVIGKGDRILLIVMSRDYRVSRENGVGDIPFHSFISTSRKPLTYKYRHKIPIYLLFYKPFGTIEVFLHV